MEKLIESKKIYIAGPYSAPTDDKREENVYAAIDAGIELYKRGHYPYVPHLTHFMDIRAKSLGVEMTWEDYIKMDLIWLKLCDALLYLGQSPGADIELGEAKKLGLLIYRNIEDIPSLY